MLSYNKKGLKSLLMVFCLLLINSITSGQTRTVEKTEFERVAGAHVIILTINYQYEHFRSEYPRLSTRAAQSQTDFNNFLSIATEATRNYLLNQMGEDAFESFLDTTLILFNEYEENQPFTESFAVEFIEEEVRAKILREFPSPYLETLLSFQYRDNPEQETIAGFSKVFQCTGHPKAKGTDWQLRMPLSWSGAESEEPNIIQQFSNSFGFGISHIALAVKKLPRRISSDRTVKRILSKKHLWRYFKGDRHEFVFYSRRYINERPGAVLIFDSPFVVLDEKLSYRTCLYNFIEDGYWYVISCSVTSQEEENLDSLFLQSRPLFTWIVNSASINNPN